MRLFTSYAHEDIFQVTQLVELLREAGHDTWFDHRLLPGQDLQQKLLEAITEADGFLYALSPYSISSDWCQWEYAKAVELGKSIIPVLLKSDTELPDGLKRHQYADFTEV